MNDIVADFDKTITQVFNILDKPLDASKYKIIDRGLPHVPKSLPPGMMGIYSFYYEDRFLKIGKAGSKSNARFLSQHYNPHSASSNLASSILKDCNMAYLNLTSQNISDWIKSHCRRIDILLDESLGVFTLELVEAILHYKYEPLYEGFSSQR